MISTAASAISFDDNASIQRTDDMIAAHLEKQTIVMHINSGNFYQLNRVATRIWDQLDVPLTVHALCEKLCEIFEVAPDQCRADVSAFLTEMHAKGIVRVTPPAV